MKTYYLSWNLGSASDTKSQIWNLNSAGDTISYCHPDRDFRFQISGFTFYSLQLITYCHSKCEINILESEFRLRLAMRGKGRALISILKSGRYEIWKSDIWVPLATGNLKSEIWNLGSACDTFSYCQPDPDFRYQISDFRFQISDLRFHI